LIKIAPEGRFLLLLFSPPLPFEEQAIPCPSLRIPLSLFLMGGEVHPNLCLFFSFSLSCKKTIFVPPPLFAFFSPPRFEIEVWDVPSRAFSFSLLRKLLVYSPFLLSLPKKNGRFFLAGVQERWASFSSFFFFSSTDGNMEQVPPSSNWNCNILCGSIRSFPQMVRLWNPTPFPLPFPPHPRL